MALTACGMYFLPLLCFLSLESPITLNVEPTELDLRTDESPPYPSRGRAYKYQWCSFLSIVAQEKNHTVATQMLPEQQEIK